MAEVGGRRAVERTVVEVVVLSVMAGGFITGGALFSTLLATGTDNEGLVRLLEGFGFSVGFFLVVLTEALLFTAPTGAEAVGLGEGEERHVGRTVEEAAGRPTPRGTRG